MGDRPVSAKLALLLTVIAVASGVIFLSGDILGQAAPAGRQAGKRTVVVRPDGKRSTRAANGSPGGESSAAATSAAQRSVPPTLPGGIQKIVHQTWKSHQLYPNQAKWRANCESLNPGWEFRIFNDSENRALIAEHYSWFLETFDGYPKAINRIDAIRIFYLAHFGGVYMDLDYTCLRPFDSVLSGARVVVAEDELPHRQGKLKNLVSKKDNLLGVGNSFMAGAAGDPVLVRATKRLLEVRNKVRNEVGNLAGVWFIRELIEEYRPRLEENGIRVLPMSAVSPMHWVKGADHKSAVQMCTELADLDKCRARFPNSTTISFWTGTWRTSGPRNNPSALLAVDRDKQVLLGLRKPGDRQVHSLRELEKAVNYTGPSSENKIS